MLGVPRQYLSVGIMLSCKLDFSFCAGFPRPSHILCMYIHCNRPLVIAKMASCLCFSIWYTRHAWVAPIECTSTGRKFQRKDSQNLLAISIKCPTLPGSSN